MKKIGIFYNRSKDKDLSFTSQVIDTISSLGCEPIIDKSDVFSLSEFIIVLGGDGTMLKAAHRAALSDIPLLGVNLGTLGYLTDIDPCELEKALVTTLQGDYKLEKRIMLQTDLNDSWAALNDIVINRSKSKPLLYEFFVNDEYIDTIRADGIIVSTPTGSTAYNLSSGGPILKPDSEMMAITAICPHSLYLRPLIISAEDTVSVRVLSSTSATVVMDGQNKAPLQPNSLISIKRSPLFTRIIKTKFLGFYEILRRKMLKSGHGEVL